MKQLMTFLGAITIVGLFNHQAALADTTANPCKDRPDAGQHSQDCDKDKQQSSMLVVPKTAEKKAAADTPQDNAQTDEVNCSDTPYNSPLCNNN